MRTAKSHPRRIRGISWREEISNLKIREKCQQCYHTNNFESLYSSKSKRKFQNSIDGYRNDNILE